MIVNSHSRLQGQWHSQSEFAATNLYESGGSVGKHWAKSSGHLRAFSCCAAWPTTIAAKLRICHSVSCCWDIKTSSSRAGGPKSLRLPGVVFNVYDKDKTCQKCLCHADASFMLTSQWDSAWVRQLNFASNPASLAHRNALRPSVYREHMMELWVVFAYGQHWHGGIWLSAWSS